MQLHHVSLGLVYLHSRQIVHGDVKAVIMACCIHLRACLSVILQLNILIDGSGKAVLCDFSLSRIKADATSRMTRAVAREHPGSLNWMAPELLLGKSLKKPCDIYAFGMTFYEVGFVLKVFPIINLNHHL
jgi:serine/threonine protein kinase